MTSRWVRVTAAIFAVGWLVPGFGLIDLSVSWSTGWPVVLEAGWGLLFSLLVGAPLVAVTVVPRHPGRPIAQLAVVAVALGTAAMVGGDAALLGLTAVMALQTVVLWFAAGRPAWRRESFAVSLPLAALALAALLPLSLYAQAMWRADRRGDAGDISLGISHYGVQAALALALFLLAGLSAVCPGVRLLAGSLVGLTAAYLGLVSFCWRDAVAGYGRLWSSLTILWGVGIAAASLHSVRVARVVGGHTG